MLRDLLPPVCYDNEQVVIAIGSLIAFCAFFAGYYTRKHEAPRVIVSEPTEHGSEPL